MNVNINASKLGSLFEAGEVKFTYISGDDTKATVNTVISGARDEIFLIVDTSECDEEEYTLKTIPGDYNPAGSGKTISLKPGKFNVVPVTSLEMKTFAGKAKFEISGGTGCFSSVEPRVAVVTFTPVVNH